MKQVNFIHFSDTHILEDNTKSSLPLTSQKNGTSPENLLREKAKSAQEYCPNPDFIVITGDLVHEGEKTDYVYFKNIIEDIFPHTKVYCCLGNHDRTAAFRKGYLGEPGGNDEGYYYSEVHLDSGIRIIALDSSYDNSGAGKLSEKQLNWLKDELATRNDAGSILILHHPPVLTEAEGAMNHSLINSKELGDIVRNSDIIAVLSGHTHQACATTFENIIHITSDSTAFGVHLTNEYMEMNNKTGYSICTVSGGAFSTYTYQLAETVKTDFKMPISELMEMMKKQD